MELYFYFFIVFLGLQASYEFSRETSITLILVGNFLIIYYSWTNYAWELLILTLLMTVAQLSRIWRGV
jgi:hypothetical protein|tara:strand:- start:107 stop:310 length:204 start_codon:yes stop_codon:yes gene_type:complete